MINLPSQQSRQWSQPNTSDFEGMLAGSFGLNLTDKHGVIKVSPRMVITTDGITNFGCPVAFKMFYNSGDANSISLYTVGGSGVFYTKTSPLLKTAFVQDDHTGVVPGTDVSSDYSDMDNFNYELYVSGKTTYFYYLSSAGVWTKSASVLPK